jgi:hypothetical protein
VIIPREALLAVLRSLRQMLADNRTTKQKKETREYRVFVCSFLKTLSDYIASNDWMTVNSGLERMWGDLGII